MIQFNSYRKRLLRRRASDWLQAVFFAVVFILLYNVVTFSFKDDVVADVTAPIPERIAFVAPQPNIIEQHTNSPLTTVSAPSKPVVAIPAKPQPSFAQQISYIQDNISSMLEPGADALVSAKRVVVKQGDTLVNLLVKKASVPREDAYEAVQALSKVYNPRDLNPNHEITVFFHTDPSVADPKFSGVRIEKDIINTVTVHREDTGRYTVNKEEKGVHRTLKGFRGRIDNSLYVDAQAAGVPDSVILDLIKMYSWNVDFQRDIHSGDKFEVMYEEYRTEDGDTVPGKGNIVYARLSLGEDEMPFYRYENKKDVDYYDDEGMSAKKPLMKTPIDGARLSSGFGMRKHPVLGYSKMHKGVDFAAPRGTPIYAAGDGTIEKIGPYSSYGKYIRISHRNGLKTAYAHMKGFKAGLHAGSRVKQGDIIGYVGTTGRSTGPHLHYEVLVRSVAVNPSSVKLPTGKALKGRELASFKNLVAQTHRKFEDIGRTTSIASAKIPASASRN